MLLRVEPNFEERDESIGDVAAVVVARMSSVRLPGKSLIEVAGKPLIAHTIERIQQCSAVATIVLATSTDPSDDRLAEYVDSLGVSVYRGSLDRVADRVLGAALVSQCGWFFRANGDSPMIPSDLYDLAIEAVIGCTDIPALATNVRPRELPPGASIELVNVQEFQAALPLLSASDQEHVTQYFYDNPNDHTIVRIDCSHISFDPRSRLVVDTAEDLAHYRRMTDLMDRPASSYSTEEALELSVRAMEP